MSGLPALTGDRLSVSALPELTAQRGKLLSGDARSGTPVHAASFIRRREIILESELLPKRELALILVHEIFHFVWARLGNRKRSEYAAIVADELRHNARGELGESAEVRKSLAAASRDYICESFCDTAAWMYAPNTGSLRRVTLAKRWRERRQAWFETAFAGTVRY